MSIYTFIYFVSMPVDTQSKELEFYLTASQVGQPLPSLQSVVYVGDGSQIPSAAQAPDIMMESERYQIELQLMAQESDGHIDKGNLFLTATIQPSTPPAPHADQMQPLTFHRMAHL